MTKLSFPRPDGVAPGNGYSHVVTGPGQWVAIAGQVALDADGKFVGVGDPAAQARQVFANLDACLTAAGATFADVVKLNLLRHRHRLPARDPRGPRRVRRHRQPTRQHGRPGRSPLQPGRPPGSRGLRGRQLTHSRPRLPPRPATSGDNRLFCWMCGWFRSALRGAPGRFPLRPRLTRCGAVRTVDGRPLLVGGGLSGERYPLDRQARLPDPDRSGERAGHGSVALEGVGTEIPARDAPRSVRVEGFLPVWGGFSSLTGLKPSRPTRAPHRPMDDCVSLRPAEREHSPLYATAPAVPHPPDQSEEPDSP